MMAKINRRRLSDRRSAPKTASRSFGGLRTCLTCQGDFRPYRSKPDQKFCKPRCRRLYWAADELAKEYRAGHADGLKEIIGKLRDTGR